VAKNQAILLAALLSLLLLAAPIGAAAAKSQSETYNISLSGSLKGKFEDEGELKEVNIKLECEAKVRVDVLEKTEDHVRLRLVVLEKPECKVDGEPEDAVREVRDAVNKYLQEVVEVNGTTDTIPVSYYKSLATILQRAGEMASDVETGDLGEVLEDLGGAEESHSLAPLYFDPGALSDLEGYSKEVSAGNASISIKVEHGTLRLAGQASGAGEGEQFAGSLEYEASYDSDTGLLKNLKINLNMNMKNTESGEHFDLTGSFTIGGGGATGRAVAVAAGAAVAVVAALLVVILAKRILSPSL
jgi:hypothetical protein